MVGLIPECILAIMGIFALNMSVPFSPAETTIGKFFYFIPLLLISLWGISGFFIFSLVFTKVSPYILIFVSSFTYVRRCMWGKKGSSTFYTFFFLLESLLYIIVVTFLFGRFYLEPNLDIEVYFMDMPVFLEFCHNCFDVGLKNFFTLPAAYSIDNPHFIQFCFGIIISGSIVTSTIKIISQLIGPKSQQDKPHDNLTQDDYRRRFR